MYGRTHPACAVVDLISKHDPPCSIPIQKNSCLLRYAWHWILQPDPPPPTSVHAGPSSPSHPAI